VRHAALITRAVLQGPTMGPRARSAPRQILRWALKSSFEPSGAWTSLGSVVRQDYRHVGVPRVLATFGHALTDRSEAKLPLAIAGADARCAGSEIRSSRSAGPRRPFDFFRAAGSTRRSSRITSRLRRSISIVRRETTENAVVFAAAIVARGSIRKSGAGDVMVLTKKPVPMA
jgi:hypothetical protein